MLRFIERLKRVRRCIWIQGVAWFLIKVISPEEAKEIEKRQKMLHVPKKDRTPIIYPSTNKLFQPPEDTLRRFNDLLRRFGARSRALEFSLSGSHYDAMYRRKILGSSEALSVMRSMVQLSKSGEYGAYFVKDSIRPDANILLDICKARINGGVW